MTKSIASERGKVASIKNSKYTTSQGVKEDVSHEKIVRFGKDPLINNYSKTPINEKT